MFSSSLLPFVLSGVHALLILVVFIYVCLFPYRMMFVSFNSSTTGVTSEAGTANPSGAPGFTPGF